MAWPQFSLALGAQCTQSFRMLKQLLRGTKSKAVTVVSLFVSSFIHKMNTAEFKSATFPNAGPRHLLDDSVMEPHVPSRGQAESSTLSSGISIGRSCKHTHALPGFGFPPVLLIWLCHITEFLKLSLFTMANCSDNSEEVKGQCKIGPSFHILLLCDFSPLRASNLEDAKSFC